MQSVFGFVVVFVAVFVPSPIVKETRYKPGVLYVITCGPSPFIVLGVPPLKVHVHEVAVPVEISSKSTLPLIPMLVFPLTEK